MTERQIAPYEKFVITTSRNPSQRTRSLLRDVVRVIPWSFHFTRGSCSLKDLANELTVLGINRCLIVHERKGNPAVIKFYKLIEGVLVERDYRIKLKGVTLARELDRGRSVFTAESKLRVINRCTSDFGEQLYTMFSFFFGFERERSLPQIPNLKGIAILFSDDKKGHITLEFQQIETKELIGPKIVIDDVILGKKGEAIRSIMDKIGFGKKSSNS
ncbi:MAG: hypothetical protein U9O98_00320 [Asgard group archaeon]|nr:hypothetical protein [Asgard group archaeon]